jgi:hypothetical protein
VRYVRYDRDLSGGAGGCDNVRRSAEHQHFDSFESSRRMQFDRFDGEYERWPSFWSTFKHEVHVNPRLTDSAKMRLLALQLEGSAKLQLIEYIDKPHLYHLAVSDLRETFDRPLLVRDASMEKFRRRKRDWSDMLADVRGLVRQFDALVVALEQLNLTDTRHESELRKLVLDQLPSELRF